MSDENLVIDLETDDTTSPVVTQQTEAVVEKAERKSEPGVEDLKTQFASLQQSAERDRVARAQAEQVARQHAQDAAKARQEATQARTETVESNINSVENAMHAAQTAADAAEGEYAAAMEQGNWKDAAKAQRKIADAAARIARLEEGKANLEEARQAQPAREQARQQQQPAQETDPVERALAGVTPRTADWLRKHPEFVTDQKMNQKANAAHSMAQSEGYVPDSDAYFDFCERFLGLKEDEPAVRDTPAPQARTRTAMPSAPVSRNATAGSNGVSGSQVTLTKGEAERAVDGTIVYNWTDPAGKFKKGDPIGVKEYARRKAALTAQGAFDRSYTDQ